MSQETIEGNKLIALFDQESETAYSENGTFIGDEYYDWAEMKYHESWDWLMPVVEKIESLAYDTFISHTIVQNGQKRSNKIVCRIEDHYYPNPAIEIEVESDTKINATWQAVVRFIKWYNDK